MKQPFLIHNHTEFSNMRLLDSIAKVEDLLDTALELGLKGICITDHENMSSHVRAYKHIQENKDRFKDFKLGYGNEIYLVDKEIKEKVAENERVQYYHFLLVAKDNKGHRALRELSDLAWQDAYYDRGMQRVPTYKDNMKEILKKYKGHVIGSSACVGGEIPQLLLKANGYHEYLLYLEDKLKNTNIEKYSKDKKLHDDLISIGVPKNIVKARLDRDRIIDELRHLLIVENHEREQAEKELVDFLDYCDLVFGDDFYLELQPSTRQVQEVANELLLQLSRDTGIPCIVTTDTHYLTADKISSQEIYLTAQNGQREVMEFYSATYLMNRQYLENYFEPKLLNELIDNTLEIEKKVQSINFGSPLRIPSGTIPEFKKQNIFNKYYPIYPFIEKLCTSDYKVDNYYMRLLQDGIEDKEIELTDERLDRINTECRELWQLSDHDNRMSSYFTILKEIIDEIWEVSLVAPSRGSACCFYTNYILDITQVDALVFDLPHWRFLSVERGSVMPDMKMSAHIVIYDEILCEPRILGCVA